MDLEIKIRKRTPEEIARRQAEEKKRECWFCGRRCSDYDIFVSDRESKSEMTRWMSRNTCGYCHGITFGYYSTHFVDPVEQKKHRYKRERYAFMKREQNYCAWLNMINNRLKREIRDFILRGGEPA